MAHTPGPKLCPKCGERQPDTQDWFGEAIRLKAQNADLLAALRSMVYLIDFLHEHPKAEPRRFLRGGRNTRDTTLSEHGSILQARAAIEKAS